MANHDTNAYGVTCYYNTNGNRKKIKLVLWEDYADEYGGLKKNLKEKMTNLWKVFTVSIMEKKINFWFDKKLNEKYFSL